LSSPAPETDEATSDAKSWSVGVSGSRRASLERATLASSMAAASADACEGCCCEEVEELLLLLPAAASGAARAAERRARSTASRTRSIFKLEREARESV
jgi:hypothetical protein